MPPTSSIRGALRHFLAPGSVAILGASPSPDKLGHLVVRHLVRGGYRGQIYPVNSTGAEVEGHKGYRSIAEVPGTVDCAFLAIPAAAVEESVKACAAAGVRSVIVGAAGFAELGTAEGALRQRRIAEIAQTAGMRVLGPNTNGVLNPLHRLSLGYNASFGEAFPAGPVAIVSHSGALFDAVAKRLRGFGVGMSQFVSVGNEADVSMLDILEELRDDASTHVVGLVLEGLSDGPRLRRIAHDLWKAGKRVVVLKIGRSDAGAAASLAHSSRLAGNSRAWSSLLDACGFAQVRTVEALAGGCALLATSSLDVGTRDLLCVTTSGAGGAIVADFATEWNIPIAAQWDGELQAAIRELPTSAPMRNPVDTGSLGDWSLLAPLLQKLEAANVLGPIAAYSHVAATPKMTSDLREALVARRQRSRAPVVLLSPGGLGAQEELHYQAAGIPVFHETESFFESLACVYRVKAPRGAMPHALRERASHGAPAAALNELDSAALLRAAGVVIVDSRQVGSADEACIAAAALGYPVVLKGMVAGVAHKFDAGLVGVDLRDEAALRAEFDRQSDRAHGLAGSSQAVFWLVQPMLHSAVELILGTSDVEGLGQFLVFGLGGVHAEALDAVQLICVPAQRDEIAAAVEQSRVGAILRKIAPQAQSQVADMLTALQNLVLDDDGCIESIDLNPVLVTSRGCVSVDALVVKRGAITA